ncbi:hypothetical protein [Bradyrhizobium sp. CCGUVB23]|uniref:hypothetical protein n=1 Tax=Bradyrhizobium sp. CCGUVB23 TaxID=2949630 RepID=UPI0020B36051|nr:hypothetical protein [Bradyrhizobium sp. CCGUVB23]MCP3460713.1 hypothetical protein [Bradyrhizobium sp. CCGUVB23]
MQVEDPNAGAGIFQTLTEDQAQQHVVEQTQQVGLTEHDAAKVAKAQKHGL